MSARGEERAKDADLHLDDELAALAFEAVAYPLNRRLQQVERALLVRRVGHEDVPRRGDELDLDGHRLRRDALAGPERGSDRVDAGVGEARRLDVGPDLDRLGRQPARDLGDQVRLDGVGNVEASEDGVRFPDVAGNEL